MKRKILYEIAKELNLTLYYPFQSTGTFRFFYKVPFALDKMIFVGAEFSNDGTSICIGKICTEIDKYQTLNEMEYKRGTCWCDFSDLILFPSFRLRGRLERAIEIVNNYQLKMKEEEIKKAKLRIECDFSPDISPDIMPPRPKTLIE